MVPNGWSKVLLGDVIDYKKGFAFNSSLYKEGGVRIIRISDTTRNSVHFENPVFISPTDAAGLEQYTLLEGDIILSTVGSRPHLLDSMVGKAVKIPKDATGSLLNQNLVKLIPKKESITNEYLFEMVKNNRFRFFISTLVRGNANQVSITLAELFEFLFLLPPLAEQKKIAQILSTWDQAIATTERLLDLARQQKKALMQQLLTGKKRFPGFEGEWLKKSLGEFGEIKSAGVDKKVVDGEIPVRLLNYTDVFKRNFIYSFELNQWVSAPQQKVIGCNVKCGDVFFTPSSETREDVGMQAVAAEDIDECCYSYHVVRFRIKEKWDLNFKAYAFTTPIFRSQVTTLADGSGQRYVVSQDSFRSIVVHYPLYEEQVRIGAAIKTAEDEEKIWERKISCLKNEKKALMQILLTGKRRVQFN